MNSEAMEQLKLKARQLDIELAKLRNSCSVKFEVRNLIKGAYILGQLDKEGK